MCFNFVISVEDFPWFAYCLFGCRMLIQNPSLGAFINFSIVRALWCWAVIHSVFVDFSTVLNEQPNKMEIRYTGIIEGEH